MEELDKHAAIHAPQFRCEEPSCDYSVTGFPTANAKKRHSQEYHAIEVLTFVSEVFRRVPGRKLSVPDFIPQRSADFFEKSQAKKGLRRQSQESHLRADRGPFGISTLEIPTEATKYPNGGERTLLFDIVYSFNH